MQFQPTGVDAAWVVALEPCADSRGFFARVFCRDEFNARGLESSFDQVNDALSSAAGTLRGLHYQTAPHGEAKLVRCVHGAAFDVLVDLRESSPTFGRWFGLELTAENRRMLYIPRGCAHGYLTLEPDTELIYFSSTAYNGESERVLRWNDPRFSIAWPREPAVISEKDDNAPDYARAFHSSGY